MQTRHYFGVQLKLAPWRAAFVLAPLLFSGSTGTLSNSQSGAVQPLPLGVAIERELAGGQSHLYELTLSLGQYAQVIIKQESIDLKASLFGPDGKLIVEVDATPQGRERVLLIAESAGAYRLAIQPTAQKAPATGYTVTLTESRAANEQDKRQLAADRAMLQGGQLLRKETAEALRQAVSKLDEATNASRVAGDRVIEAIALSYLGAAYDNLGQKQQALDSYHKSLSLSGIARPLP
jgi:tetratricopeptide (TPR) repeat protein